MLDSFDLARFRFILEPETRLALHSRNPGNTLRGAFGATFKRLVCPTPGDCHETCRLKVTCPYGQIFEPSPPPGTDRLSLNQDIPRPFILRPPTHTQISAESGRPFAFDLILIGNAIDHLPYFLITFRELGQQGIGFGRGRYELSQVLLLNETLAFGPIANPDRSTLPSPLIGEGALPPSPDTASRLTENGERRTDNGAIKIYSSKDQLVRPSSHRLTFDDCRHLASECSTVNGHQKTVDGQRITVRFLTPTHLKADGRLISRPDFHHLIKRLRDRINALAHFYCNDTLDLDHKAFGRRAEAIRTVRSHVRWEDRDRRSWKTGHTHGMGGFIGEVTYEGGLEEFLPLLILGQYTHVGKYAVWGNGQYEIIVH